MSQQLHSYAVFCDDIRQETNGKTMFIGTFRDLMYFNGPGPWVLANFHIHVVFRHPVTDFFPMMQFQIRLANQFTSRVVYQMDNSNFEYSSIAPGSRMDYDIEPFRQTRFTVSLAQLVVDGESRLSVHALFHGQDVIVDRLRILQAAPPPPPPPPLPPTGGLADYFANQVPSPPPLPPRR